MHVLLADDQAEVRSALRFLLEQEPGMSVVGEAADAAALLDVVQAVQPDLVLLDWELLGLQAPDLLPALRCRCRRLILIALSGRPEACQEALNAGVDAFVSKGEPPEHLLATLYALTGRAYAAEGFGEAQPPQYRHLCAQLGGFAVQSGRENRVLKGPRPSKPP
jgi:DNA-binding NarL/FixJ family response regulator